MLSRLKKRREKLKRNVTFDEQPKYSHAEDVPKRSNSLDTTGKHGANLKNGSVVANDKNVPENAVCQKSTENCKSSNLTSKCNENDPNTSNISGNHVSSCIREHQDNPKSGTELATPNMKGEDCTDISFQMDKMEVGVAAYGQGRAVGASPDRGRGSPRGNLHVEFAQTGEMKERKEKYLTAKYGAHQMSLIRKRLGVEMWMFDQLQCLYPPQPDGKSEEKEVDLDELLDVDDDSKRRKFLRDHLSDCKLTQDKVDKFIEELLERAKTL